MAHIFRSVRCMTVRRGHRGGLTTSTSSFHNCNRAPCAPVSLKCLFSSSRSSSSQSHVSSRRREESVGKSQEPDSNGPEPTENKKKGLMAYAREYGAPFLVYWTGAWAITGLSIYAGRKKTTWKTADSP